MPIFKKGKLSKNQKKVLVKNALAEFGDRGIYSLDNGTLGMTLYVHADTPEDAHVLRRAIPLQWNGYYTIVLYYQDLVDEEYEYEDEELYHPE